MPDLGASLSPSPPAASHTSTQQWQSFEIRMRHRRAERCVLRAEVALEAGFEEDARAALDEARRLNSHTPDLDAVRATVAERLAADAALRRTMQRRRSFRVGAAALLFLSLGTGPFWPRSDTPAAATTAARRQAEPSPAGPGRVAPAPEARASSAPLAATADSSDIVREPDPPPSADEPEPRLPSVAEPSRSRVVAPARLKVTAAPALPEPSMPATALPSGTMPIERVIAELTVADGPAGETSDAAPAREEPLVRAALARYESAYSALNASAAQAVWPGADERALARAFESLESQRVSLGRCSVQVQGATALADCRGSVTWTPKVGSGAQTQARQWHFELARTDTAWQITRAEAR